MPSKRIWRGEGAHLQLLTSLGSRGTGAQRAAACGKTSRSGMWQSEGTTRSFKENTAAVGSAARFWQMAGAGQPVKRDSSQQKRPSLSQWLEFIGELKSGRPIEITFTMAW